MVMLSLMKSRFCIRGLNLHSFYLWEYPLQTMIFICEFVLVCAGEGTRVVSWFTFWTVWV